MPPHAVLDAAPARQQPRIAAGREDARWWARAWPAPLWAHVAVLTVVLLALAPFIGTDGLFSGDEGALAAQVRQLHDEGTWSIAVPFPEVDPDGLAFPYDLSQPTADGAAPFVKHPVYPWLSVPLFGLGGLAGIQLLSVAGTAAAAAVGALVARRLRPGLERPTLWVIGLGSPLLFDSYLLIAHTLGAALTTGALLAGLVAVERRRPSWAAAVFAALGAAVLLRNEAVLYGLALAGAFGLVGLRRRDPVALTVAGVAGLAAVAAKVFDAALSTAVAGRADAVGVPGGTADGIGAALSGRVGALATTMLAPSYGGRPLAALLVLLTAVCLGAAALATRRPDPDRSLVTALVAAAAGCAVLRLVVAPASLVPGLLVAFPLLAGLCLLRRSRLRGDGALVALTAGLFVAGVAATQYASGGSGEWGGRYFALALPALVPLALVGLADAATRFAPAERRRLAAGLVVVTAAFSVLALLSLRAVHDATAAMVDQVAATAAATDPGDGGAPVVLTTADALPRLSWDHVPGGRWLLVDEDEVREHAARLRDAGVTALVFVGDDPDATEAVLDGTYRVASTVDPVAGARWTAQVLEAR